jgi:hypothetical protein
MSSIQVGDLYVQVDVLHFLPRKHNHFVIDSIAPNHQTGCWVDANARFCSNAYDLNGCEPGQIRLESGKMRRLTEIEIFELRLYCLSLEG